MDKLVKEHPYIATIEEAYLRIVLYTHCENMQENELCKEYLRQKYFTQVMVDTMMNVFNNC